MYSPRHISALATLLCLASSWAGAGVVINEFQASPNPYLVEYDASTGMPRIGYGPAWWEAGFYESAWLSGTAPIGHTSTPITTNVLAAMQNKTPSLYTRKTFTVSAADQAQTADLILTVWYDDGFVAIINGKEITRANLGPAKQVTYRDQVTYRNATAPATITFPSNSVTYPADPQPAIFNLGPLNQWLVAGENVLAFQTHNRDLLGGMRFDASLSSSSPAVSATLLDHNFNNSNGAVLTHQRNGSTVTNTPSGPALPSGSWLGAAVNPTSDSTWPNLTLTTTLVPTGGILDTGFLKYDLTQSATSALGAAFYTPPLSLANQVTPGAITSDNLSRVELSFRFKTNPSTAALGLRIEPTAGNASAALTGFPNVSAATTQAEDAPEAFATASGGYRSRAVGATGSVTTTSSGVVRFSPLLDQGPNLRNATYRYTEANTAGIGFGGSTGCLKLEMTDPPNAPGENDYVQFGRGGHSVRTWTAGAVAAADLGRVDLTFGYNLPSGVTAQVWVEPDVAAAGYVDRADFGTITGTGAWQAFSAPFSSAQNTAAMLTRLNAGSTTAFRVYFRIQSTLPLGQALFVDSIGFSSAWRTYSVALNAASAASVTAFLTNMNATARTTCQPVFFKTSSAVNPAVDTISIDDFRINYRLSGGSQNWVTANSAWRYFVGRHEPNAGIVDPAEYALTTYDGEVRDWVELKNDGPSAQDIGGWSLTDDPDLWDKWKFPAGTSIPAGGYLVVFCDGRTTPLAGATYLHTNFSLKDDDEHLTLHDAAGNLQSAMSGYPKQNGFHTYGYNPAGSGEIGYLRHGTPGRANTGPFQPERVKTPDFIPSGGFYDATVLVSIVSETAEATIRYTTDGSEPTIASTLYTGPITLATVSQSEGHVLRARAWKAGAIQSDFKTATYLINQNANLRTAPAIVFTGDPGKSLYTPYGITAIVGGVRDTNTIWHAVNTGSYNNVLGDLNNAVTGGQAWERPFTVEIRYADGRNEVNEEAGIRISGSGHARPRFTLNNIQNAPWSYTSFTEKPSFNVFFRDEYGDDELSHQLFPRGYPIEAFRQLRVRAGKNDTNNPFVVDEFMRRLYISMGQQGSRGVFNTLYVNGKFRGIYNTTERLREPFMRQHFNSDADWDVRQVTEIANGDAVEFNNFVALMDAYGTDPTNQTKYDAAISQLDADAYIDYALVNIWGGTGDWPHNNYVASRERTPTGKWRWFVWDAEGAFGGFSKTLRYNVITQDLLVNPATTGREICRTYDRFSKNQEFRLRFADHIHRNFCNGGPMGDANMTAIRNAVVGEYQPLFSYILPSATLGTAWFSNWVNTALDKRDVLFGSNYIDDPGTATVGDFVEFGYQFTKANLWPALHGQGTWTAPLPPAFGQHGGDVGTGYALPMLFTEAYPTDADRPKNIDNPYRVAANQAPSSLEIWYTLDGSDPRLPGGAKNLPSARKFTGNLPLTTSFVNVKARTFDAAAPAPANISVVDNRWSPITEATFRVAAISPAGTNLVIAELLYNPSAMTAAETSVADSDDFEFIRLLNISTQPVKLAEARFDSGVGFDFATGRIPVIDPGQSVLIVSNLAAFRLRYGNAYDSIIAGEFTGTSLNNGGERLRLRTGVDTVVVDMTYDDNDPWPVGADGDGSSLILVEPEVAPNHSNPLSWVASARPGGTLGAALQPYSTWRSLFWDPVDAGQPDTAPAADWDHDGMSNVFEYAMGANPRRADANPIKTKMVATASGQAVELEFRTQPSASGYAVIGQFSTELQSWHAGAATSPPTPNADGTVTHRLQAPASLSTSGIPPRLFMRLKLE
jgi:hypothetical protein